MLDRIICFGCSFTYGQGLADCNFDNTSLIPGPSKQAYPFLLGQQLNVLSINQGKPGCSNLYITNKILDFEFKQNDFVIVQWTHTSRHTLFNKKVILPIGPWVKEDYCKQYYSIVDNEHLELDTMRNIHHIELYLKSKNLPFIYGSNTGLTFNDSLSWPISSPIINFRNLFVDSAPDIFHAGPISHQRVSQQLTNLIKEKYDTTN